MQKSAKCAWMTGELTDKETIARIDEILENHYQDQFEILLYKKNSKFVLPLQNSAFGLQVSCRTISKYKMFRVANVVKYNVFVQKQ